MVFQSAEGTFLTNAKAAKARFLSSSHLQLNYSTSGFLTEHIRSKTHCMTKNALDINNEQNITHDLK